MIFRGNKFEINLNDARKLENVVSANSLYVFGDYVIKIFLDKKFILNINGILNHIKIKLLNPKFDLITVPFIDYITLQKAKENLRTIFNVDRGCVIDEFKRVYPALVLPYIKGFDLGYNFRKIANEYDWNENDLKEVIKILLAQVYIFHNYLDIVHTDLTPANIIVSENRNCYIIDWECCFIKKQKPGVIVQLPNTNLVKPPDKEITPEYDIWYLGEVLFYLMVCLDPKLKKTWYDEIRSAPDVFFFLKDPVGLKHLEKVYSTVKTKTFPPDYKDLRKLDIFNNEISQEFVETVRECISRYVNPYIFYKIYIDPNCRPNIHEILMNLKR